MTQPRHGRLTSSLLLGLLLAACSGAEEAAPAADGLPANHPPLPSAPATAATGSGNAVVLETMDSGGYTYARVAIGEDEMWTAGPQTPLAVGDTVSLSGPMPMSNFRSNTLDRTFDVILFVDAFASGGTPPAATGRQGEVIQAIDAAGYTYLEVDVDGERLWLAGPQTVVTEGDVVSWEDEMTMRGFTSSTLNRTFDEILFVGSVVVRR